MSGKNVAKIVTIVAFLLLFFAGCSMFTSPEWSKLTRTGWSHMKKSCKVSSPGTELAARKHEPVLLTA